MVSCHCSPSAPRRRRDTSTSTWKTLKHVGAWESNPSHSSPFETDYSIKRQDDKQACTPLDTLKSSSQIMQARRRSWGGACQGDGETEPKCLQNLRPAGLR